MQPNNYPTEEELLKDPQGSLDIMYNRGVEESLLVVRGELAEVEKHSPADSILRIIIIKLTNLKHGTSQSNPPSSV
jgi:hypothetical protein